MLDRSSATHISVQSTIPSEPEPLPEAEAVPRKDGPTEADFPELPNLLEITDNIYSGGEPQNEEAFAELVRLGVKTIVSVDGARPNVEEARQYGLRYVHIPTGYDGISKEAGLSLARLVRDAQGPFYIHCHHGVHRGPAAAAVACIASGAVDGEGALKILEKAGTGKDYAGLWRDVESYTPPPAGAELPELVEIAEVGSLAAAMAKLDRASDDLKLCRDANWSTPPNHPDLIPAREALLIKEGLHEAARNLANDRPERFRTRLSEAETIAGKIEDFLKSSQFDLAGQQFETLRATCKKCHQDYRN